MVHKPFIVAGATIPLVTTLIRLGGGGILKALGSTVTGVLGGIGIFGASRGLAEGIRDFSAEQPILSSAVDIGTTLGNVGLGGSRDISVVADISERFRDSFIGGVLGGGQGVIEKSTDIFQGVPFAGSASDLTQRIIDSFSGLAQAPITIIQGGGQALPQIPSFPDIDFSGLTGGVPSFIPIPTGQTDSGIGSLIPLLGIALIGGAVILGSGKSGK